MVRDVFHMRGLVHHDHDGRICEIVLDALDPLGPGLCAGLQTFLESLHVAVNLGEI
jgi:hypothetical protein